MKNYAQKYLPLIIGSACAVGILVGNQLNFSEIPGILKGTPKKEKLARLIDYIDYEYVDDVNTDSIVDVTINSILSDLDPHSTYIPKKDYAAVSQNMQGDFVGIGVSFTKIKDTVAVIRPLQNSPSEKAGIQPGDRILYVDKTPLFNRKLSSDSLMHLLKGEINTKINLKVYRKSSKKLLEIKVKRNIIPIKSVVAAYMLNKKLGYIKINRFAENTYDEFETALSKLVKQGATELTLDLRDNGGGYLGQAIKIADEFLKDKKLILFTKNKNGKIKKTFATDHGQFKDTKVYVLINENSASASEIVTGALQDNDVGTIVGRRSYGKGLVQREMSLGDGSVVRLTVARYYTPTGRSIQKPYGKGNQAYFHEYLDRYENGELLSKDSIHVNDSLKYKTPKGKIVYGGGGIIPDIFVAKDLHYKKESLTYMLRGGVMDRFIFDILEKNRTYYNNLTWQEFEQQVKITDAIIDQFKAYLRKFEVEFHSGDYKALLREYLKATMAQQLFGTNAFEELINHDDPMIQKVEQLDAR